MSKHRRRIPPNTPRAASAASALNVTRLLAAALGVRRSHRGGAKVTVATVTVTNGSRRGRVCGITHREHTPTNRPQSTQETRLSTYRRWRARRWSLAHGNSQWRQKRRGRWCRCHCQASLEVQEQAQKRHGDSPLHWPLHWPPACQGACLTSQIRAQHRHETSLHDAPGKGTWLLVGLVGLHATGRGNARRL